MRLVQALCVRLPTPTYRRVFLGGSASKSRVGHPRTLMSFLVSFNGNKVRVSAFSPRTHRQNFHGKALLVSLVVTIFQTVSKRMNRFTKKFGRAVTLSFLEREV